MSRIENIKYLKQIGASLKLQDDVAKKVGGYESPLFVPTVEFILKLQNSFLSQSQVQSQVQSQAQSQSQAQGVSGAQMPNNFDPELFKGVDLDLAKDVIKADAMQKGQKKQALAYIKEMVKGRDEFLDENPDFDDELIPSRKKDKKRLKQQERQNKKSGLLAAIIGAIQALNEKNKKEVQLNQQVGQRLSTQLSSQQAQQQARLAAKAAAKRNIMSVFRLKKAILQQNDPAAQQNANLTDKKPTRDEFLQKLKQDVRVQGALQQLNRKGHKISDSELLKAAQDAKTQLGKASKDLLVSKVIDELVKGAEAKNDPAKVAQQNDLKSKEALIDQAAAKLSSTGITQITSLDQEINNKKALEEQAKIIAEQQKQRG